MSYLSDSKCTKSKTLRTASAGRITNWTNPPWEPVLIIRTKDWYFYSLIIVNTATSYFFTNLHVIYFWNGHRERRSSHWHLQLHARLAERYRWRCADLHSDAIHALINTLGPPTRLIGKILGRCKYKAIFLRYNYSVRPIAVLIVLNLTKLYLKGDLWVLAQNILRKLVQNPAILEDFISSWACIRGSPLFHNKSSILH